MHNIGRSDQNAVTRWNYEEADAGLFTHRNTNNWSPFTSSSLKTLNYADDQQSSFILWNSVVCCHVFGRPQLNLTHASTIFLFLGLSPYLLMGIILSGFPTKILYLLLINSLCTVHPVHLMTRLNYGDEYKLRKP